MLTGPVLGPVLGHSGALTGPHDLVTAWNLDPLIIVGLVALAVLHRRGRRPTADDGRRSAAFASALLVLVVALISPLEALSGELLSAHMVQHVLLVLVAGPLLAFAAPGPVLHRGLGPRGRTALTAARRTVGIGPRIVVGLRSPAARWLFHVLTFWLWHASALYAAAVGNPLVHGVEHLTFLVSAWLLWSTVVGPRRVRLVPEAAILSVFALGLQSVLLSALLVFSRSPWYRPYVDAAGDWGLDPLTDQQLAGALMMLPGTALYTGVGVTLLVRWLASLETGAAAGDQLVGGSEGA